MLRNMYFKTIKVNFVVALALRFFLSEQSETKKHLIGELKGKSTIDNIHSR